MRKTIQTLRVLRLEIKALRESYSDKNWSLDTL